VGTLINGTTEGRFLDHPSYDGLLTAAVELHVPIYIHPHSLPGSTTGLKVRTMALIARRSARSVKYRTGAGIVRERPKPQAPRPSRRLPYYCSQEE
jgi:hypothetical protein